MTSLSPHPLDRPEIDDLWVAAAAQLGFRVERTGDAYAASDGGGTIQIGAPETLDADDSVAQLVFHELCHAAVEGEAGLDRADWGLDNTSERDLVREHACLRLQAHLADERALRPLMVPTTVSRGYYQGLPVFPLAGGDPAAALARQGARFAGAAGWLPAIAGALAATAAVVRAGGRWTWSAEGGGAGPHPLGMAGGIAGRSCRDCAWCYQHGAASEEQPRCRRAAAGEGETGPRVDPDYPACQLWEPALDCQACAACCREGFDRVTVGVREEVVWRHPALVERHGPRFALVRAGGACAALASAGEGAGRFRCTIYQDRPRACHELAPGGARCLAARRALGLSR